MGIKCKASTNGKIKGARLNVTKVMKCDPEQWSKWTSHSEPRRTATGIHFAHFMVSLLCFSSSSRSRCFIQQLLLLSLMHFGLPTEVARWLGRIGASSSSQLHCPFNINVPIGSPIHYQMEVLIVTPCSGRFARWFPAKATAGPTVLRLYTVQHIASVLPFTGYLSLSLAH